MKFTYLGAVVSVAICLVPGMERHRAISQTQPDYACFLTTSSGKTVDFSQGLLCGAQKTAAVPLNTDEAFLAEYKRNAMQYAEVRDSLLASATQSPEISSMQAKQVCSDLQSGLSLDEIKQKQSRETVEQSSIVNAQIVTNLASKYYCPNLAK
ncbi:DUF732 domain-containing protein [Aliterella atlantica]|uniref:DUF732 domain-containing protein n=1 Tax=Aliterella atlantica CENA595 TaxID=1618023 RepID=A0A0D9A1G1_9CYAN|nr:DUF732 domain-containing protein [Aliterella atlantica]KJH73296.1 hypothetical protein UH38_00375 [Aliterella atlantica CENA595]